MAEDTDQTGDTQSGGRGELYERSSQTQADAKLARRALRAGWNVPDAVRELIERGAAKLLAEAVKTENARELRAQSALFFEMDKINLRQQEIDLRALQQSETDDDLIARIQADLGARPPLATPPGDGTVGGKPEQGAVPDPEGGPA